MPGTIQSFFAAIDPGSPPPQQPRNSALRRNRSHRNETFKLKLLRWRRRVLPPGLPAVRSKFQRHRLATQRPYARSVAKDRLLSSARSVKSSANFGSERLQRLPGQPRPTLALSPSPAFRFQALGRSQGKLVACLQRGSPMREVVEAADGGRTSKQISLRLIAQLVLQELQFGIGLDAFREHGQAEAAAKAQYRPDNRRGLTVGVDRLDEGAVDLDPVERKRAQIGQR